MSWFWPLLVAALSDCGGIDSRRWRRPGRPGVPSAGPCLPGSEAKILLMRERAGRREALFHVLDGLAALEQAEAAARAARVYPRR
jgi:hypothetical protein